MLLLVPEIAVAVVLVVILVVLVVLVIQTYIMVTNTYNNVHIVIEAVVAVIIHTSKHKCSYKDI